MKRCSKCGQVKPLNEFHRNKTTRDGYQNWCKVCRAEYNYHYAKSEKGKAAKRRYRQSAKGKTTQNKYRRSSNRRRWLQSKKGKASKNRTSTRMQTRWPNKYRARWVVANNTKTGKIPPIHTRHCADCGGQAQFYHHEDYSKPLDIVPLCRRCDRIRHQTS